MNTYLKNYWALYREFIEIFKNFRYKNIPIALLTNFYQHIDQELKLNMEDEHFPTVLTFGELEQEEIQPYFEKWLQDAGAEGSNETKAGKTLINYDYTRIPESCYQSLFDPAQTILLSRSQKKEIYGIPAITLQTYEEADEAAIIQLVKSANTVFAKLDDHPALGNEFFQQTFLDRIPLIVKTIDTVFHLFNQVPISTIVVGTTEDIVSRSLAIVGSLRGIKSVCLQHGILMGEEAFMPVFTSTVAVYGEYEKNWYLQRGLAQERIAEIGHPKYDEIYKHPPSNPHVFQKKFNLDSAKSTLLVITGPNLDVARFIELIKHLKDRFNLIIKPHPWEIGKGKYGLYLKLEKKYKSVKVFTSRENYLYDLISHVDGVVATLSTVALESILFNKPVFIYDFVISNRSYEYYQGLGEFMQTDPDVLSGVIHEYFFADEKKESYGQIRSDFVSRSYNDGTSGKKLIDHIQNLTP
jgi:hypothetical protein